MSQAYSSVVERGCKNSQSPLARRFLFLDECHITQMNNLVRVPHKAQRHPGNPLITPEYPWEAARTQVDGNRVIYDPLLGKWRMYYMAQPRRTPHPPVQVDGRPMTGYVTMAAYAESEDGIQWRKPMFRQKSFENARETNLLAFNDGQSVQAGVMFDPHDADPGRRYKMFYWDQANLLLPPGNLRVEGHGTSMTLLIENPAGEVVFRVPYNDWGMYVAVSGDGIHWRRDPEKHVLHCYSDTGHTVMFDERLRRYVAFGRFNHARLKSGMSFYAGRSVARIESDDFRHWSEPELVLTVDQRDPEGFILNSMPVCIYEGLYIGVLEVDRRPEALPIQLAVSRDGRHWSRVADRFEFMDRAAPGRWDGGGMCRAGSDLFVVGDQVRLYYCSGATRESSFEGIGLVTWRRDGFVSIHADAQGGELLTAAVICDGSSLHLNLDATHGHAVVQVCDLVGKPISDFAGGAWSEPLSGDQADAFVRWPGAPLATLGGRSVTLRVRMTNCDLYSFWFA